MKICLVTAFPPSREALNEYGFHIARELKDTEGLEVTVLGDDFYPPQPELDGYNVVRCWAFNGLSNPWRLIREIRRQKPDVVWFNLGFASFGGKPLPAFIGIAIPAIARMSGVYTHVTLHQLMETVDLKDAGIRFKSAYRAAGFVATQLLLFSNSVSVLLPAYRSLIREKYRRGSVHVRRHGILSGRPEYPDFSQRGNPYHRVLAFGKWGTYKRLEPIIDAFVSIAPQFPQAKLVIAGTDHPKAHGYVDSMMRKWRHHPQIEFVGYVAEEEIPALFQSTTVAVMPYSSSAGSSGVAHLACAYGVPILASDIADFRQLVEDEGLAMDLVEHDNTESLGKALAALLADPDRQTEMAIQNFSAALRMSMPEIIRQYLRTFDLQKCLEALTSVARLRKMPRWVPFRPLLVRMAGRRMLKRIAASSKLNRNPSIHCNGNSDGAMRIPGIAVDSDAEAVASWSGSNDGLGIRRSSSPTSGQDGHAPKYGKHAQSLDPTAPPDTAAGDSDAGDPEASPENTASRLVASPRGIVVQAREHRGERDGQRGTDGSAPWKERSGRE